MNRSHPYSGGRRNPIPMADLVDLCPTLRDEKPRKAHGGKRARGKPPAVMVGGK